MQQPRARTSLLGLAEFVLLFLPVAVAVVGLVVLHRHTALGIVLLVVAGMWMLVAFLVRHRHDVG